MQRTSAVFLLLALLALSAIAQQDVDNTFCPICNMVAVPAIAQAIQGDQAIYACDMAGHFHQLTSSPKTFLRGAVAVPQLPAPYVKAKMGCPVCGHPDLTHAVPWGPHGNQKIFACSEDHAKMILDNPAAYFVAAPQNDTSGFCHGATGMYDGFQSAIDGICPRIFFESWVLNSGVKYALGFCGVVLLGLAVEGLVEAQTLLRQRWTRRYAVAVWSEPSLDDSLLDESNAALSKELLACDERPRVVSRRLPMWCKACLAGVYMCTMTGAYLLMLVVMTYETGLFIAAVLGLGLGFFFFKDVDGPLMEGNPDPCCST
ncbi:hypothetical protein SPRG_02965 [Saprolegnia parasitica CBS 223.65]|uniref:Copper transport protein n=1 Tax=Saprolegnia parasitica (strain CBS 223.65) TaxID=695850 RepID=A0A067CPP1_SAPPC|nr:hypothetical protein SPRG_02965 [Saprolegnia parasitica CBS 223.65]KDO32488.1 hypothetical protein SPRG_02965 [Saprolegnia parasitica CBS 223.65]|eukprot:XP_012196937.1 hypothetical protein SPRG_02965 [Saprolegnia parasitica CBS 223.65]